MNELRIIFENNIYKDTSNNISVGIFGDGQTDRGFINTPYFKVFNNSDPRKATKIARIEFNKLGDTRYGHSNKWELNSQDKKILSNILNQPCNVGSYKNTMSTWEAIKKSAADLAMNNITDKNKDDIESKVKELEDFNMPDVINIYDHKTDIYSPNFNSPHKRLGR